MKVFKVDYDDVTVGIVVNKDGNMTNDDALSAWNNANPNFAGDSAEAFPFLEA